jgi:hypothetical protein
MNGHPVLTLIRVSLFTAPPGYQDGGFGHFVVIRGLVDQGATVVFNDSYPGEQYWGDTSEKRRAAGEGRREGWYEFDRSWSSYVDEMDPLGGPNFKGHVRWAMAVR